MNHAPEISVTVTDDVHDPPVIVVNGDHDLKLAVNGVLNGVASDNIDMDHPENESDARHEPLPIKTMDLDDASIVPQVGTPVDPGIFSTLCVLWHSFVHRINADTIPIHAPKGTPPPQTGELLEEVRMAEDQPHPPNGLNGTNGDVPMTIDTPVTTPGVPPSSSIDTIESNGASTSHTTPNDCADQDDDQPRPAKRPRVHSDADKASLAHVSRVFLCAPLRAC